MTTTTTPRPVTILPAGTSNSARRLFARLVATYPATRGAVMPALPPRGRAASDR